LRFPSERLRYPQVIDPINRHFISPWDEMPIDIDSDLNGRMPICSFGRLGSRLAGAIGWRRCDIDHEIESFAALPYRTGHKRLACANCPGRAGRQSHCKRPTSTWCPICSPRPLAAVRYRGHERPFAAQMTHLRVGSHHSSALRPGHGCNLAPP